MPDKLSNDDLLTLKLETAQRIRAILDQQHDFHGHYSVPDEEKIAEGIHNDLARASRLNQRLTPETLEITVSTDKAGKIVNLLGKNGIKISDSRPKGTNQLLLVDVVANRKEQETEKHIETISKLIEEKAADGNRFTVTSTVNEKGEKGINILFQDGSKKPDDLFKDATKTQKKLLDRGLLTEITPNAETGVVDIKIPLNKNKDALIELASEQAKKEAERPLPPVEAATQAQHPLRDMLVAVHDATKNTGRE